MMTSHTGMCATHGLITGECAAGGNNTKYDSTNKTWGFKNMIGLDRMNVQSGFVDQDTICIEGQLEILSRNF